MLKEYKTVLHQAFSDYEEKKSRFIATVKPVKSESEAQDFINGLKTKYWDATHNVFAYCVYDNTLVQRFSDAGEPSGTAGLPVLEVIKRMELYNVAVVITRYFGGTLLGAAGLVRAYGKSATLGIEAAGVIRKVLCLETSITIEYTLYGKVNSFLMAEGYTVKNTDFSQDVEITVYVPVDTYEKFEKTVIELTNDRALFEKGEEEYVSKE